MKTKRCRKCVISLNTPGVTANKNGVCSLCAAFVKEPAPVQGSRALLDLIGRTRGTGGYDCAVAFSGGKDSTFVLYRLVKHYKLKVLAITADDYLGSPQAWRNRALVTKKLGVDHVVIRYDWTLYREAYRASIIRSGMRPRAINLIHNLIHERALFDVLQRFSIPLLATGNSEDEIALFQKWGTGLGFKQHESYSLHYWNDWRCAYIKVLREILAPSFKRRVHELVWPEAKSGDPVAHVTHLPFFRYERFDVEGIVRTIERELGWVLPQDVGGTETDSAGLQFDVTLYRKLHGNEEYARQISHLVRSGKITREIALKALNFNDDTFVRSFLKELHLSYNYLKPHKCTPLLSWWISQFLPIR